MPRITNSDEQERITKSILRAPRSTSNKYLAEAYGVSPAFVQKVRGGLHGKRALDTSLRASLASEPMHIPTAEVARKYGVCPNTVAKFRGKVGVGDKVTRRRHAELSIECPRCKAPVGKGCLSEPGAFMIFCGARIVALRIASRGV